MSLATSYNQVIYESEAIAATNPGHLAVVTRVLGLTTVSASESNVLEIGCGIGTNLLSLATMYPQSRFEGIDLSSRQIEIAQKIAGAASLTNVGFSVVDLANFNLRSRPFDFIIAHGLFSWISRESQEALFALCQRCLAPNGIAYISFNTFPGWHMRLAIRELMRYAAGMETNPLERARRAKEALATAAQGLSHSLAAGDRARMTKEPADLSYDRLLHKEIIQIQSMPDWYLTHDLLAEHNDPSTIADFIKRAAPYGLRYLGDAEVSKLVPLELPQAAQSLLGTIAADVTRYEYMADILRNRMFRRTLLCRSEAIVTARYLPASLRSFYFSTALYASSAALGDLAGSFEHPSGGALRTKDRLLTSAIETLIERAPRRVSYADMQSRVQQKLGHPLEPREEEELCKGILRLYLAELVSAHDGVEPFVCRVNEYPEASPLARAHLTMGERVTTLRHETIQLNDTRERALLARLDGKTSLTSLRQDQYLNALSQGMSIERVVASLAEKGLLVA